MNDHLSSSYHDTREHTGRNTQGIHERYRPPAHAGLGVDGEFPHPDRATARFFRQTSQTQTCHAILTRFSERPSSIDLGRVFFDDGTIASLKYRSRCSRGLAKFQSYLILSTATINNWTGIFLAKVWWAIHTSFVKPKKCEHAPMLITRLATPTP